MLGVRYYTAGIRQRLATWESERGARLTSRLSLTIWLFRTILVSTSPDRAVAVSRESCSCPWTALRRPILLPCLCLYLCLCLCLRLRLRQAVGLVQCSRAE